MRARQEQQADCVGSHLPRVGTRSRGNQVLHRNKADVLTNGIADCGAGRGTSARSQGLLHLLPRAPTSTSVSVSVSQECSPRLPLWEWL